MKNTTKVKIWGFTQLVIGAVLIVLAWFVYNKEDMFGNSPNVAMFVIGILLAFWAFIIIIAGFDPQFAKFSAKMRSETLDYAKDEIKEATSKQAETVVPAVTPTIKRAYKEIKDEKSVEDKLKEAKRLFDNEIITAEEYKEIRRRVLDDF